jgi:hypothetical protein
MTNSDIPSETAGARLSRRQSLKRFLQAGTAAYVAPIVLASVAPLAAQASHPECVGASCTTFLPCSSSNTDCVCVALSSGGGFCVPGSTSCGVTGPCGASPGFACPANNVCAVNTCCGTPVCVPTALGAQCPAGSPSSGQRLPSFPSGSLAGK